MANPPPFSTVGGYPNGPVDSDSTPWVDTTKGVVPNGATFTISNSGLINGGGYGAAAVPVMLAILVELRLLNTLKHADGPYFNMDLASMRADEVPGATGGTIV